jgi:hypothetical protein
MQSLGAIPKDGKNDQQGWSFRKIETILSRVHPLFGLHGVFVESQVIDIQRDVGQSKKGDPVQWTVVKVRFRFCATDGSSIEVVTYGESMDSSDKSAGKAQTYALKVALTSLLAIPIEVSDPDEHTPDFIRERRGGITLKDFSDLKREWFSRQKQIDGWTKEKLAVAFQDWAREQTNGDLVDVSDWRQWKKVHLDSCLAALHPDPLVGVEQ